MSEAVPLAHALVARLAELEGVRVLFIKGPTAVALGARPPRSSTDVDVLCEPGGLERLGPALERCRWRRRVPEGAGQELKYAARYLFEHSVHFIHDEWPCDLDIHYNFPGFLAPDDVVFEELWRRRTSVEVAHWPVPCADLLGQSAIVALHGLRDPESHHAAADLSFVVEALGPPGSRSRAHEMAALAAATGSSESLRPLLDALAAPATVSQWSNPEMLRRWQVRTQNSGTHTTSWLIELRRRPWREKPTLIRRALLVPTDQLFSAHVGLPRTRRNAASLHLQRWVRAIRFLPHGLTAARDSDRWVR